MLAIVCASKQRDTLLQVVAPESSVSRYVIRYQQCTIMDYGFWIAFLPHEEVSVLVPIPAPFLLEILRGSIL